MLSLFAAIVTGVLGCVVVLSITYLLVLMFAAALYKPRASAAQGEGQPKKFVVLIPAHNEEQVISATLQSLSRQDYPRESYEVVVIADNCTDTTAALAERAGAIVLRRANLGERGKGYALDWALQQLIARDLPADAFAIVDADTWVAPDFLTTASDHLTSHGGWSKLYAIQGRYGVDNFGDGWRTALMSAAFDLFNHIKPCGREALKLSVGLKGNGMVFSLPLMREARWSGTSVTEDIDFGIALARDHRLRVAYEPRSVVMAQMPATTQQATSQRRRWEIGRYQLVKQTALPLFAEGLKRRNVLLLDTALDLMILPMGELAALGALWSVGTMVAIHAIWPGSMIAGSVLISVFWFELVTYVLYGLKVAGARSAAYKALIFAPFYVIWKLLLYVPAILSRISKSGSRTEEWTRTERIPIKDNISDHTGRDTIRPESETIR